MKKILVLTLAFAFSLPALASAAVIYNSIPSDAIPGSYPSLGFQATKTNEFGDYIEFTGVERTLTTVDVLLNSWACQGGNWFDGTCANPDVGNTGYDHEITLTIYNVDVNGVVGSEIASVTETIHVPWRPASDPACVGGGYNPPSCTNGYNFVATLDFTSEDAEVPDNVAYGISFNTKTYGETPTGINGPYNSLNMSLPSTAPTVGTDTDSDAVEWNTETVSYYTEDCPGDTFCKDTAWSGYVPAARFNAVVPTPTTVTVTIDKYVDGVHATADNADSSAFPMSASWSATNIGAGTGTYELDANGFNNIPTPYQAITSPMTSGADYSTYEITSSSVVGASCDGSHDYALVGYTTGDTLALAETAPKSTVAPSFTGLTIDKYVIVWNQTCQDPPVALTCPDDTTISPLIETVTVPASASVPIPSINILASGTDYLLKAYGVANAGDGIDFDARYSFRTPTSAMWTDAVSTYESYGPTLLDLFFNGATPWGDFNHAHEYWSLVSGTGAVANFSIYDAYYPNNTGDLKVDIYACMPNIKYVTGGGNYKVGTGKNAVTWTFGGNVWQTGADVPVGQFELVDHANKTSYHFSSFTGFTVTDGNTAMFTANGTAHGKNAPSGTITADFNITDGGEPGADDTISVSISGDPSFSAPTIGGNFQVFVQ